MEKVTQLFSASPVANRAQATAGMSPWTLAASAGTAAVLFLVQLLIFLVLRNRPPFDSVYRTSNKTNPDLPLIRRLLPTEYGIDAYFFLRFVGIWAALFCAASLTISPLLMTINALGEDASYPTGAQGLDRLSWVNNSTSKHNRLNVHLFVAITFICCLGYVILHELQVYTNHLHNNEVSEERNCVLLLNIPQKFCNDNVLERHLDSLGLKPLKVTMFRDLRDLKRLVQKRDKFLNRLEGAETAMILSAVSKASASRVLEKRNAEDRAEGELWKTYLHAHELPHHYRLRRQWPFVEQVESLSYYKLHVNRLNGALTQAREHHQRYFSVMNNAVVQFYSPLHAQILCQTSTFQSSAFARVKCKIVDSDGINWESVLRPRWKKLVRRAATTAISLLIIIGWTFPVTLVGLLTQVNYLTQLVPPLSWIHDLPSKIQYTIAGALPAVFLSLLLSAVPLIFSSFNNEDTFRECNLVTQRNLFLFLFIQVFLVITISSGVSAVAYQVLHQPTTIPQLLASNLPKAANFFLSYIILQGLTTSGIQLLCIDAVFKVLWRKLVILLTSPSPRRIDNYQHDISSPPLKYCILYPVLTNLAVITIVYAVICPAIVIFAAISFTLLFMVFRFRIAGHRVDRGMEVQARYHALAKCHVHAMFHIFFALYCMEVCLIGLFLLQRGEQGGVVCTLQSLAMIVMLISTAVFHHQLYSHFSKQTTHVPLTLFQFPHCQQVKEHPIQHPELCATNPPVWIPQDDLGVALDQIQSMQSNFAHLTASFQGATATNGSIQVSHNSELPNHP